MSEQTSRGKLIVIEGIDGAGKSSIAARVVALLQEDRCDVVLTREPGGTPAGAKLRALVGEGIYRDIPEAEFLLFAADRAVHINTLIAPSLKEGKIVISDRMGDSSIAYQGYALGLSLEMISQVNNWVTRGIKPDLTVYLVIDYTTARQRITSRREEMSSYDHEKAAFFKKVIQGYETLYANRKDVLRLDATLTIETCAQIIYQKICYLLGGSDDA